MKALSGNLYVFPIISSLPLTLMIIFMLMIFKISIYAFCVRVTNFTQFFILLTLLVWVYTRSLQHFYCFMLIRPLKNVPPPFLTIWQIPFVVLIRRFAELWKVTINIVVSESPSVRPCALNNSAPTERILNIFYIWAFFENMLRIFKFH